jgi:alpha-beta hydrolase superfamily lysophospholipase
MINLTGFFSSGLSRLFRKEKFMPGYSQLDNSPLVGFLFYPRGDFTPCPQGAFDFFVPVEQGVSISCRFYMGDENGPWILYFHGNGEVVSDYDGIAPFYHRKGINLVVADFRGYGASGGSPNFTNLVQDASPILEAVKREISQKGLKPNLWVMGRSMGSIPALELADRQADKIKGLVVESGFASVTRLIKHLGLPSRGIDLEPLEQERMNRIRKISIPTLVIHGERDNLVPLQEARDLYALLGAAQKKLVIIPKADHNNIMFAGLELYLEAIQEFVGAER